MPCAIRRGSRNSEHKALTGIVRRFDKDKEAPAEAAGIWHLRFSLNSLAFWRSISSSAVFDTHLFVSERIHKPIVNSCKTGCKGISASEISFAADALPAFDYGAVSDHRAERRLIYDFDVRLMPDEVLTLAASRRPGQVPPCHRQRWEGH